MRENVPSRFSHYINHTLAIAIDEPWSASKIRLFCPTAFHFVLGTNEHLILRVENELFNCCNTVCYKVTKEKGAAPNERALLSRCFQFNQKTE